MFEVRPYIKVIVFVIFFIDDADSITSSEDCVPALDEVLRASRSHVSSYKLYTHNILELSIG